MKQWITKNKTIFVFLVISILYLLPIQWYPLLNPDESRYAEVVREMISYRDWITPRLNGLPFFDKPILFYWFQSLTQSLGSISPFTVRFNIILFGLIGIGSAYYFSQRWIHARAGFFSMIALSGMPMYFVGAHYANLDLFTAIWISLSIACFYTASQQSSRRSLWCAYFFMACAFLSKGLIGFVFPVCIGSLWIIAEKRWQTFKALALIRGLFFSGLFILPWFFLVEKKYPGFFQHFFIHEQAQRFLSTSNFNNPEPFWFYIPIFLIGSFPWCLFLFYFPTLWKNPSLSTAHKSLLKFLMIWILFTITFFSLPHTKIITYILPAFFPFAVYIGLCINYMPIQTARRYLLFSICSSCLIYFSLLIGVHYFHPKNDWRLAETIKHLSTPPEWVVDFEHYDYDLALYLKREIYVVSQWNDPAISLKDNWKRELFAGSAFEPQHPYLISPSDFCFGWDHHKKIIALFNKNSLDHFPCKNKHYYIIDKQQNTVLIRNY